MIPPATPGLAVRAKKASDRLQTLRWCRIGLTQQQPFINTLPLQLQADAGGVECVAHLPLLSTNGGIIRGADADGDEDKIVPICTLDMPR